MSSFTITPPTKSVLITLDEGFKGQVDIIAHSDHGSSCRIAAIGNGKLHLFRQDRLYANGLGLQLDANGYPCIGYVGG